MRFRNPGAVIEETIRLKKLNAFFKDNSDSGLLIDLACGARPYYSIYENKFARTIGIEHPDAPFPKNKIDIYCLADAIPLDNECADVILSTEMLHDMPDPLKVLQEAHRLLRNGGQLVMTTPFLVPIVDGEFDHYRYTRTGLDYLLKKSGFQEVRTEPVSDIFGASITLCIKPWLRLWNVLSKKMRIPAIYSYWNPFLCLTVLFPQLVYLFLAKVPGFSHLFRKFSYGSIGYFTVAKK